MNYEGEKFLLKLYKDLYSKKSIKHSSAKSDNKYETVKKYMERLERVHEKAINHKTNTGINILKNLYYDKYVIKKENISENYIKYLDKIQFNQYGVHISPYQERIQKELIIKNQKDSLNEWLEYLTSEDTKFYPTWAKYWAFQGMLTIGNYDQEKETYTKRSKTTVAPFPELDKEILSKTIDLVIKEINKEEIEDKNLEKLVKNGNFFKLYTVQLKNKRKQTLGNATKGKWIKYEQGDNYQKLYESLQGQNTGWCTAGEQTCKLQIQNGDFYVYYIYDKEENPSVPRIAIRMDGQTRIGEIRGINKEQNIEPDFEDILSKKLEEFPDAERYNKKIKDIKTLTYIYTKYENKKPLTKDDLRFIYELDNRVETMNWTPDKRLEELKENALKLTLQNSLDKSFLLEALEKNPQVLKYIPQELVNKELSLKAVTNDGYALEFVPSKIIDQDIALEAVKAYGDSIIYVPKELIDKKLALEAIKTCEGALYEVPPKMIDQDFLSAAVKLNGLVLDYAQKELINKEIAMEAIKENNRALEFIPQHLIDKTLILEALKDYGTPVRCIPKELIDKEIAIKIVQNYGYDIKHIPKEILDKEIALEAVKEFEFALELIPEEIIDKEIIFIAKCNETKYKLNLSEQQKKLLEEALQEEIEKAQTLGKQGTLLTKEILKEKYKNETIYNLIKSSNQEGYNYYLKSQKNKVRKK